MGQKETDTVFFVLDSANKVYFVLVHDDQNNTDTTNYARILISSPDLSLQNGGNVSIRFRDDPRPDSESCANEISDCYAFNSTLGEGHVANFWVGDAHEANP